MNTQEVLKDQEEQSVPDSPPVVKDPSVHMPRVTSGAVKRLVVASETGSEADEGADVGVRESAMEGNHQGRGEITGCE